MADLERCIQAFENKCYRRMLGISYREHKTNECVWQQVSILAGPCELLLSTVKRRKSRKSSWFWYVCHHDTLLKIILQGSVDERRRRDRPNKSCKDTIKAWTGQSMFSASFVRDTGWATSVNLNWWLPSSGGHVDMTPVASMSLHVQQLQGDGLQYD